MCIYTHTHIYIYRCYIDVDIEVAQSCPTLCDPMDCSLPGSTIHGIFQAIILDWVAISFSRRSSWPRDRIRVSCIVDRRLSWVSFGHLCFKSVNFTRIVGLIRRKLFITFMYSSFISVNVIMIFPLLLLFLSIFLFSCFLLPFLFLSCFLPSFLSFCPFFLPSFLFHSFPLFPQSARICEFAKVLNYEFFRFFVFYNQFHWFLLLFDFLIIF